MSTRLTVFITLSLVVCTINAKKDGLLSTGKRTVYELSHKPKRPVVSSPLTGRIVPSGDIIAIKNWGDKPIKGSLYIKKRRKQPGMKIDEYLSSREFETPEVSDTFELKNDEQFESEIPYNLGMPDHIELEGEAGKFSFVLDARNKAWQDIKLNGKKVDGVRVWINSVWDEIKNKK